MSRIIVFAILFSALLGCSGSKKIVKGPPPERTKEELIEALNNRNYNFSWFSGKASTELKSPDENVSGSMQVRMRKDSIVWIAVKKFGIEAARIQVDKSHYTILYRLEGLYQKGPISGLNEIISISPDFEDLQQLMFGNVILPDSNNIQISKESAYYVVHANIEGILIDYWINAYNLILEKADITDRMNRKARAEYSDYRKVNNGHLMAFERKLDFPYSDKDNAFFYLKFSDITVDEPVEIKFSIPKSYSEAN